MSKNALRDAILIGLAKEALKPENLLMVAKGPQNRKKPDIQYLSRYGMCFYVAGHVSMIDELFTVYSAQYTSAELCSALKNTAASARVGSIEDIVFQDSLKTLDEFDPKDDSTIYILTNEEKRDGAGLILCDGVLRRLHQKLGDYWIVPSCIHELLLFPVSEGSFISRERIVSMVAEVTRTINSDDRLIDSAFFYDGRIHE